MSRPQSRIGGSQGDWAAACLATRALKASRRSRSSSTRGSGGGCDVVERSERERDRDDEARDLPPLRDAEARVVGPRSQARWHCDQKGLSTQLDTAAL